MEMEKSYYVVTSKPSYAELLRARSETPAQQPAVEGAERPRMFIASITQGGFGQDVIDEARQVKERFLEYLFASGDVDLPRSADSFDRYFELGEAEEFIDLDDET